MEPTLTDGDGLIAVLDGRVRPGQLRVFEHPMRPDFWLVKRVEAVDGGAMIVRSDNRDAPGAVDSATLGPIETMGSYRVVVRIPRRWM